MNFNSFSTANVHLDRLEITQMSKFKTETVENNSLPTCQPVESTYNLRYW